MCLTCAVDPRRWGPASSALGRDPLRWCNTPGMDNRPSPQPQEEGLRGRNLISKGNICLRAAWTQCLTKTGKISTVHSQELEGEGRLFGRMGGKRALQAPPEAATTATHAGPNQVLPRRPRQSPEPDALSSSSFLGHAEAVSCGIHIPLLSARGRNEATVRWPD